MRILVTLTVTAVLVLGVAAISIAQVASGVVAQWSGTYTQEADEDSIANCPGGGVCAGDLETCPDGEGIAITKTTFYFLEGICDDAMVATGTACAGRFTALAEECSNPAVNVLPGDIKLDGSILSVNSRGTTRICFDNSATPVSPAVCTGTPLPPDGVEVIGTGSTLTQTRLDSSGTNGVASATTETKEISVVTFRDDDDGLDKRLRFKETIAHITAQPNDGCGVTFPGCGVAGTSVVGRPGKK